MTYVGHGTVSIDYHQFWISTNEGWPSGQVVRHTGLIEALDWGARVTTGIAAGKVTVEVQMLDSRPLEIDTSHEWEAIAEVSIAPTERPLDILSFDKTPDDQLLNLTLANAPTWHRVRAHCRNRDHNLDGVDFSPVEEYLLQIWPTQGHESPTLLHGTDEYSQRWGQPTPNTQ